MTTRLASRFGAFVAERYPFALGDAVEAFEAVTGGHEPLGEAAIDGVRSPLHHELTRRFRARPVPAGLPEPTPGTSVRTRLDQAETEWLDACDGFLRRAAIEASLTPDEQREILKLIFARNVMGRPYVAPPNLPADRLATLRQAFMDTMKDKDFLAEADKTQLEVNPVSGEDVDKLVKDIYATPADIVAKAKEAAK